ncbi:MAG: hypothetical protein HY023_18150 [Chloroflexi bacterium]|nr:hypothetical protein [Chloroflexota bacterium]MBI3763455.1 hypothetical protein [Chloroflexota bacterium]
MTYNVLLRKRPKGGYIATALGWPEVAAEAATRAEAIDRIRKAIAGIIAQGELVQVEVPLPQATIQAVYAETFGMFRNDPTFGKFVTAVNTYRRKRNRNGHGRA